MLYVVCPSCKTLLGNKQLIWEEIEKQIIESHISDKQKEEELEIAINSLGLKRYCCKMRVKTYTRLVEVVK